tara:strand:+ start:2352 stop:5633 length:3282 start_codon:yes stop_codon:yes gene_type:complete
MANPTPEYISQLIKDQFPEHYLSTGPELVAFALAYYEWLEETGQHTKVLRQLRSNRDIDNTVSDFIIHFKKTFLSGTQFNTVVDERFMLKHISDVYQSKGSVRSVELLLQMFYGQEVEVFLPSTRVTYPSDSEFKQPIYLELSGSDRTKDFVGKTVRGSKSDATAFVESVVTKLVNKKQITVAYMSSVIGNFVTDEYITDDGTLLNAPVIVGSLSGVTITNGGQNFAIGDQFDIISSVGKGGKAKITGTTDATGKVNFLLANGGYGYTTSNAYTRSLSSNATIELANITNANTERTDFFLFEPVEQDLKTITYTSAGSNANFQTLANTTTLISGANSAHNVVATGYAHKSTAQTLIIQTVSGAFASADYLFIGANTVNAQIDTLTDSTANGELIAQNSTHIGLNANNKAFYSGAKAFVVGRNSNTYANVANVAVGSGADYEVGSLATQEALTLFTDIIGANNTATSPKPFANVYTNASNSGIGFVDSIVIDTQVTFNGRANTVTPYAANGKFANTQNVFEANVYVDRISIHKGGTGYSNSDTVSFSGATAATNAVATVVTWANGTIKDIPLSNNGISYKKQPAIAVSTSSGSGANLYSIMGAQKVGATATIKSTNTTVMILRNVANGSFTAGDIITNEGVNAFANSTAVATANGTGYIGSDTIAVSGNATATFAVNGSGALTSITVSDPGSGYSANATGTMSTSSGSGLSFSVNMDFGYGFQKSSAADLTTILYNALTFSSFTIGEIASLNRLNPGAGYNMDPLTLVHNPYIAGFNRRDLIAVVSNKVGSFNPNENLQQTVSLPGYLINHSNSSTNGITLAANSAAITIGEGVIQLTTNATGIIESSNATHIKVKETVGAFDDSYVVQTQSSGANVTPLTSGVVQQSASAIATGAFKSSSTVNGVEQIKIRRLKFGQAFANGSTLTGLSSGATATVENVYDDEDTMPIGLNASISANVQTANGIATGLEILDSGYGYEQNATVQLTAANTAYIVTGTADVTKQGVGQGYWVNRRSFPSDINKIHDNDYYQDYSYVTRTGISLERYEDQLKEILHVAGLKLFGEVVKVEDSVALTLSIANSSIASANAYESWMN